MTDEIDYVSARFTEEWERADTAHDPRVRRAHLLLAEAYLDRLEQIARGSERRFRRGRA